MLKLGRSAFHRGTAALMLALGAALLAVPLAAQNTYGNPQYPQNRPYQNNGYGAPNAIPEGTRFMTVLDDKLDTKKIKEGKTFKLKLAEDLTAPNGEVIPRGKKIKAHVSS